MNSSDTIASFANTEPDDNNIPAIKRDPESAVMDTLRLRGYPNSTGTDGHHLVTAGGQNEVLPPLRQMLGDIMDNLDAVDAMKREKKLPCLAAMLGDVMAATDHGRYDRELAYLIGVLRNVNSALYVAMYTSALAYVMRVENGERDAELPGWWGASVDYESLLQSTVFPSGGWLIARLYGEDYLNHVAHLQAAMHDRRYCHVLATVKAREDQRLYEGLLTDVTYDVQRARDIPQLARGLWNCNVDGQGMVHAPEAEPVELVSRAERRDANWLLTEPLARSEEH
ncbi:hypothetical protein AJ79_02917 [Helicocarpus griseus UAMH5409]|uniref:Uncharacterized protein n=1 Tax=Helicocarpus griseus UAMH5409 TaxID=1447875 RepID=A0A2B7Y142_9EURO|nr:hypothetical protein AJ79_02917 [Helicocarpus griseus UAMH5409]